ncbi:MAG: hypothetical protein H6732_08275 [Alphaproteobacteria bacterium]|nr:hypothetical protein [Alphaproteobacteria bacterium]
MRTLLATLVIAPMLTACASASCRDLVAAQKECNDVYLEAIGSDPDSYDIYDDDFCSTYDLPFVGATLGVAGAIPNWACQAAAYREGDCTTAEGYADISNAVSACD